jgi:hypothetical protein
LTFRISEGYGVKARCFQRINVRSHSRRKLPMAPATA